MFRTIYLRELKQTICKPVFLVFFIILTWGVYKFAANIDPNTSIFFVLGREWHNAPIIIARVFSILSAFGILFTMILVGRAVTQDFLVRTHDFFFTLPLTKFDYLGGRFLGAFTGNLLLFSSVIIGFIVGCLTLDPQYCGPFSIQHFLLPFLTVLVPNTLLIAAVFFALATLSRKMVWTYVTGIIFLTFYLSLPFALSTLESETVRILADPFGMVGLKILSQNWTVAEINTFRMPLDLSFILNRMIYLAIAFVVMVITFKRFKFITQPERRGRQAVSAPLHHELVLPQVSDAVPPQSVNHSLGFQWRKFLHLVRRESKYVLFHPAFIILTLVALSHIYTNFVFSVGGDGHQVYPVTSWYLKYTGMIWGFMIPLTIVFGALIVWRERDHQVDEIYDSLPVPDWMSFLSKLSSLFLVQFCYVALALLTGIVTQLWVFGFSDIELGLYIKQLFGLELLNYWHMAVIVFLIQTLSPSKILGIVYSTAYFLADVVIFSIWQFDITLLRYGYVPEVLYSNIKGFGSSVPVIIWYQILWLLMGGFLLGLTSLLWRRGSEISIRHRAGIAAGKITRPVSLFLALTFFLSLVTGGFIACNRYVVNAYINPDHKNVIQSDYEKKFSRYNGVPQPAMTGMDLEIDIYPETRSMKMKGSYALENKSSEIIDQLYITFSDQAVSKINRLEFSRPATLLSHAEEFGFRIYNLEAPLLPAEVISLNFDLEFMPKGFTDSDPMPELASNGTHFSHSVHVPKYFPWIGYNPYLELLDKFDREQFGLDPKPKLPVLEAFDPRRPMMPIHLISYEAVISTSEGQTAVTNGKKIKQWTEQERVYSHYRSDHVMPFMIEVMSAEYEIEKTELHGVIVEILYDKKHHYNIHRMIESLDESLPYYNRSFGPYPYDVLRIVEVPTMRRGLARAQPTIFSWSEDGGFLSRIDDPEEADQVFLTTAHELAHQWWGYVVTPAKSEGAFMLTETMAQFASAMCLERKYGQEIMSDYREDEMKSYLRRRSRDRDGERPMCRSWPGQDYMNYPKSTVTMYALKEYIGEDAVNMALKHIIEEYGFREDVFAGPMDLIQAFRSVTPEKYQYLVTDLFEKITLYDNRVISASAEKLPDNKFKVTLQLSSIKYYADEFGAETAASMSDYIPVSIFGENEEVLYSEMHRFDGTEKTVVIGVDKEPVSAGIDPRLILIDRDRENNVIPVEKDPV